MNAKARCFGCLGSFSMTLLVLSLISPALAQDADGRLQQTTTKTLETYVPRSAKRIASIELLGEAAVSGDSVTLKQICRWGEADNDAFADVANLVVVRFDGQMAFSTITNEQVQQLLCDAGANVGSMNFAGAATCTVSRSDMKVDEAEALKTWVGGNPQDEHADPATQTVVQTSDEAQAGLVAAAAQEQAERMEQKGDADSSRKVPTASEIAANTGDLRARLILDIAMRLNLPPASLQVDFRAEDRKTLSLREPFQFSIDPQRYGDLGDTSWIVTITSGTQTQKVRITATARAWMDQVVVTKPLGIRQTITEADIESRRVLADKLTRDPLATKDQIIGQQAAKDLRPGMVMTAKMLAPVELVRAGQLVTVHMRRGAIDVKTVALALQSGSDGQQIKVKNDKTNEVYQVILTGKQEAILSASDAVSAVN